MGISEDQYRLMLMRAEANAKRNAPAPIGQAEEVENDLQDYCIRDSESRGWWVDYSRMDKRTTRPVGAPDLYVFADRGRLFIVEGKARNEKLRPAQLGVKLKLEALGHIVHVIRSKEEWHAVVDRKEPWTK